MISNEFIKVCSKSFSKNLSLREQLLSHFPNAQFNDNGVNFTTDKFAEFVGDSIAIIAGLEPVNTEFLDQCRDLKFISKFGVGIDNIDLDATKKHGVSVGWSGGLNRRSVSELVLCYMIGLTRNIFFSSRKLIEDNDWSKNGGQELSGKVVGIIGLGHIGKDLAKLLKPFGCRILVNDVIDQTDYYEENDLIYCSKPDIFEQSDILTVHTPLNQSTEKLFDLEVFKKMKDTSYFINCARGGLVVQSDLKSALQEDQIAGAAIDVFEAEPSNDQELLLLPNLICTPHIGGSSSQATIEMGRSAISHLISFFSDLHE
jgi:phosphoglycerate dehydrogenase-like enzyme